MNLPIERRWLMPLAWAVITALVVLLALREGFGRWQLLGQWQGLAESAAGLQPSATLSVEQVQQSAQARQISIDDLQPEQGGWQVRGHLRNEQAFQDWLQGLQREGGQPLAWGLEQGEAGLRFELVIQP